MSAEWPSLRVTLHGLAQPSPCMGWRTPGQLGFSTISVPSKTNRPLASRPERKDRSFMLPPLPASGRLIHGLLFARSLVHPTRADDRLGHHWGKRGYDMSDDLIGKWELSRRRVLGAAAGLGLTGMSGGAFGQQGGPWSVAPKSKVDRLNFVVWTY